MIDAAAVRRLAMTLPEVEDRSGDGSLSFTVRGKQFAWSWQERADAKGPRRPRPDVLTVRCEREAKAAILASDAEVFFTEPHYDGFPAVLVRLDRVGETELGRLLASAWRCQAPRALVKAWDGQGR
jgi:hypothetical protein